MMFTFKITVSESWNVKSRMQRTGTIEVDAHDEEEAERLAKDNYDAIDWDEEEEVECDFRDEDPMEIDKVEEIEQIHDPNPTIDRRLLTEGARLLSAEEAEEFLEKQRCKRQRIKTPDAPNT